MKQVTSAQRQNELLRELQTLNEQFEATKQELAESLERQTSNLQQQYSGQRQQLAHQTLIQRDQTENGFQQQLLAANEEFSSILKTVTSEFNEKTVAAQSAAKTAKSDGEYDWFLSKQRLVEVLGFVISGLPVADPPNGALHKQTCESSRRRRHPRHLILSHRRA